jgi:hypothetical protein
MSIHYLIDPFTTNGDIIDVITAESGQTDATGATVVRVPDGVAIHNNPTDVTNLLTQKYDGLLGFFAGFTQIVGDSCMGGDNVATVKAGITSAGFVNHGLFGSGVVQFGPLTLPFAPTQCVLTWELFSFTEANDKTGRYQRVYVEEDPNLIGCNVSFDNGAHLSFPTSDTVLNIPVIGQGTTFILNLSNVTSNRYYLGSWALIF